VSRYHIETKHHFNRHSRSLGYLDWATQPSPWRRYTNAKLVELPFSYNEDRSPPYHQLYTRRSVSPQPLSISTMSKFLELALGITSWKKAGQSMWALRSNPSSGNLHPTEGYVILPSSSFADAGLYHYAPKEHGLELRAKFNDEDVIQLLSSFPAEAFIMGLTSVHWREAWKYGERAFRYCNHDVGHAIASIRLSAASFGWKALILDSNSEFDVGKLLGTSRAQDYYNDERDHPDCLMVVWPMQSERDSVALPLHLSSAAVDSVIDGAVWSGMTNRLSRKHEIDWDIIEDVALATSKNTSDRSFHTTPLSVRKDDVASEQCDRNESSQTAAKIFRQRRSAVNFDGRSYMPFETFCRILYRALPSDELPVWDVWPYRPTVHLAIFVHRVHGLQPGLYFFPRGNGSIEEIMAAMSSRSFEWSSVSTPPDNELPLYRLHTGDLRGLAKRVSCNQDIAAGSAFSLGMIAEFSSHLELKGPWWYKRMFWEAGIIGHMLYVESEAMGFRSTGIGCFYDDAVHDILGLSDLSYQSLYHFTVGVPVEDTRVMSLPPYHHLSR